MSISLLQKWHKLVLVLFSWLRRRDLSQLFDEGAKAENIEHDIQFIRQLLDEDA